MWLTNRPHESAQIVRYPWFWLKILADGIKSTLQTSTQCVNPAEPVEEGPLQEMVEILDGVALPDGIPPLGKTHPFVDP